MTKHEVFVVEYDRHRKAGERVFLCAVQLDDGRMSADRYNRLHRQMVKTVPPPKKAHFLQLETADGLQDTFGGYPAFGNVLFEKR